jgi:hypothetical protein
MKRSKEEMAKWDAFFAGMGDVAKDRAEARAEAEGESLTTEMKQPGRNISAKTGRIERSSPLFWGTGANPTLF